MSAGKSADVLSMDVSIMGREYPEREVMPSSESWGVAGWTQTDLESAHRKFNQLTQERGFPHTHSAVGKFGLAKGTQGGERLPQSNGGVEAGRRRREV